MANGTDSICPQCGAELTFSQGLLVCQYCGGEVKIKSGPAGEEAACVIPLAASKEALRSALLRHISSGPHTPDDILEAGSLTDEKALYVPAYVFQGDFKADWAASFGYDRTEYYTERDGDGKAVKKSRTITDWRPASGRAGGSFTVKVYAGREIKNTAAVEMLEGMGDDGLTALSPSFLAGHETEPYALEMSGVRAREKEKIEALVEKAVKSFAQGDRRRDWSWTSEIAYTRRAAVWLPVGQALLKYKGGAYNLWADGVSPDRLASDPLPVDSLRRRRELWGYAPFWASALTAALSGLMSQETEFLSAALIWALSAGWTTFLFGFLRAGGLRKHSRRVREVKLAALRLREMDVAGLSEAEIVGH